RRRSSAWSGVFFNAILGGVVAREHRLDPIGFAVLAVLSGLGGGIIRDTLLQAGPPVALVDNSYVLTALVGAAIAFAIRLEGRVWDRAFPPIDALARGVWAVVGAQKTLGVGLGPIATIILGLVTAVGGGFCLLACYRGWVLPAGTGWKPPRPSFRRILPRRRKSA